MPFNENGYYTPIGWKDGMEPPISAQNLRDMGYGIQYAGRRSQGSYRATDVGGKDTPNQISPLFLPEILIVYSQTYMSTGYDAAIMFRRNDRYCVFSYAQPSANWFFHGGGKILKWEKGNISWYADVPAPNQSQTAGLSMAQLNGPFNSWYQWYAFG